MEGAEIISRSELRATPPPAPAKTVAARAPVVATASVVQRIPRAQRDALETEELRRRQVWLEENGYRCDLEEVLENFKSEVDYGRDFSRKWRGHRSAA